MQEKINREHLKRVFASELEPFDDAAEAALEEIVQVLSELTDQAIMVISMRWGIGEYDHPHTLEDVAKDANCTRERVRQIEQKCLAKVRQRILRLGRDAPRNKQQFWPIK